MSASLGFLYSGMRGGGEGRKMEGDATRLELTSLFRFAFAETPPGLGVSPSSPEPRSRLTTSSEARVVFLCFHLSCNSEGRGERVGEGSVPRPFVLRSLPRLLSSYRPGL